MKKLAKKKVSKRSSIKRKIAKNPENTIKLTPSNLKKYGEKLLGRHNHHSVEDLVKLYNKNKFKITQSSDDDYDYDEDHAENYSFKVITAFDKILENYGVEIIRGRTSKDTIVYSNNGDMYAFTVLFYKNKYYIGGIADILEENRNQYL